MGKGTNSTTQNQTQSTSVDPQAMAAYQQLIGQAQTTASTPWNSATGQQVAGFTPDQLQAFANVQGGIAQPFIDQAAQFGRAGGSPITPEAIQNYANPWTQQVVDSTMADFARQNERQISGVTGNARMAGSLGGDREQVAKALTAREQASVQSPIIANLHSQGFQTALGAAQGDAQRALAGAGVMGNLGQLAYTDTNALMGIGGQQQQLHQAQFNAASQNASAQSAHPFQTQQWLASILGAATPNMGSTTTSTGSRQGPQPNTWSQAVGIGIAALPYLLAAGGAVPGLPQQQPQGIGYVPVMPMPSGQGRGIAPHPTMSMGPEAPQKSMADHYKEIRDTAQGASQAYQGIGRGASNLGQWSRTEAAPNGWGSVTTTYPDASQNFAYGVQNTLGSMGTGLSNFGSGIAGAFGFGGGYADGGAIEMPPGIMLYPSRGSVGADVAPDPRDLWGPSVAVRERPQGIAPIRPMQMPPSSAGAGIGYAPPEWLAHQGPMPPITDAPPRPDARTAGAPPNAGIGYAPPPPDPAPVIPQAPPPVQNAFSPPATPQQTPSQGIGGLWDRFNNWRASPEGTQFLTTMGATMMAGSGIGGRGSFGMHAGQGLLGGIKAQQEYGEAERRQRLEQARLGLQERQAAIADAQEQRAIRMAPYERQLKDAQARAAQAQIDAAKIIQVDPTKQLYDSRTQQWITPPAGGQSQEQAAFNRAFAQRAPEMLEKAATAYAEADGMASSIRELQALAPHAATGFAAEQLLTMRRIGSRLGLDVDYERIAGPELFRSLSQNFILQAAQKLKPLSNADLQFVERGLATLQTDPSTLPHMLAGMEAVAKRTALAEDLKMAALRRGQVPDYAQIARQVDQMVPSPILRATRDSPTGGVGTRPRTGAGQSETPQRTTTTAAPPPAPTPSSEAARTSLVAQPDGLVIYQGRPYYKEGTQLTPAPDPLVRRNRDNTYSDRSGNIVPQFD